jgi:hypothetical protein
LLLGGPHFKKYIRIIVPNPGDDLFDFPLLTRCLIARTNAGKHRYNLFHPFGGLIARAAGRERIAFWPPPFDEELPRRNVILCHGARASATEDAGRMLRQEFR